VTRAERTVVTIRRATAEDLEAVADVYLASRRAAYPAIPPSVHADEDVRTWMAGRIEAATQLFVAEGVGGRVVAMMVLDGNWLDQLYVDPAHAGSGVGSQLLEFAKMVRPAGLQLWTFESNTGARRFYERHGFVPAERTDGSRNEERAPDIRYVWPPRHAGAGRTRRSLDDR